jgi:hypothetical protein
MVTQNPKTDTEESRGKLGQKSGRGDEDHAQEESHRGADGGGVAAGGSWGFSNFGLLVVCRLMLVAFCGGIDS